MVTYASVKVSRVQSHVLQNNLDLRHQVYYVCLLFGCWSQVWIARENSLEREPNQINGTNSTDLYAYLTQLAVVFVDRRYSREEVLHHIDVEWRSRGWIVGVGRPVSIGPSTRLVHTRHYASVGADNADNRSAIKGRFPQRWDVWLWLPFKSINYVRFVLN